MYLKQRIKNQIKSLSLIGSVLLSSGCLHNTQPSSSTEPAAPVPMANHPLNGTIVSMVTGQPLSYTEMLKQLKTQRFILLGEKHDNPEHHLRELQLLKGLQNGDNTRLVLEMLDEQQAENIDQLTPDSSEAQIQENLHWNENSWPWQDYGPLISAALADHNQLKAGNLSKPVVMQIYQHGIPDEARLTTVKAIPETVKATIQQQVYDSHCQAIPFDQMGPMTKIQLSRDASMAYSLADNLGDNRQAVLISGSFHSRKDTGVPLHLQQRSLESVSILLIETDAAIVSIDEAIAPYSKMADYIWFTSRSAEKDYCASLRQQSHQQSDD
ncbi:hypothetical protein EH243_08150 [Amphritea opalescens]|uniref:Haem-binding uptake Tiki superfamily ChaN domain-containing protein n=1 Tax=Amphritea opalescens TaxID=2490544 RepID=A0A430KRH1_9GAMM|nr:ChaN family lipoprotein [Amphritea opalescens]RTE66082.1 hypothetical protein EH243_08150 [Amphritea opalescens]